jgi:hypothetical protein
MLFDHQEAEDIERHPASSDAIAMLVQQIRRYLKLALEPPILAIPSSFEEDLRHEMVQYGWRIEQRTISRLQHISNVSRSHLCGNYLGSNATLASELREKKL